MIPVPHHVGQRDLEDNLNIGMAGMDDAEASDQVDNLDDN